MKLKTATMLFFLAMVVVGFHPEVSAADADSSA